MATYRNERSTYKSVYNMRIKKAMSLSGKSPAPIIQSSAFGMKFIHFHHRY